jgi:hypothetical protein
LVPAELRVGRPEFGWYQHLTRMLLGQIVTVCIVASTEFNRDVGGEGQVAVFQCNSSDSSAVGEHGNHLCLLVHHSHHHTQISGMARWTHPTGRIMNSCMARALPAWEPPLMMLKEGTGRTSLVLPARSAMCLYRGTPFSAAPAWDVQSGHKRVGCVHALQLPFKQAWQ